MKERIPYEEWSNSHLSIAKHYSGIKINGVDYVLDYENCRKEIIDGEDKFFPDLVIKNRAKKRPVKNKKPICQQNNLAF